MPRPALRRYRRQVAARPSPDLSIWDRPTMLTAFRHEAVPYAGQDGLVSACHAAAIRAAEQSRRLLVLAGSDRLDDVRDGLGDLGARATFVATDEHGRNPGRMATMLHGFANGEAGSPCMSVYDNDLRGRSPAAIAEAVLAECLMNRAPMHSLAMTVLCLFDRDDLDPDLILDLRRAHPIIDGRSLNPDFDEAWATALHGSELLAAPPVDQHTTVEPGGLAAARSFVRSAIADYGLPPDRADDLVLAVNEVVANSLRHGGGRAVMSIWRRDGAVTCEVRDHGYLRDPMTGRLAPDPEATGGRGLWLVHHLCDLVQLRSSESTGTVVRMIMDC